MLQPSKELLDNEEIKPMFLVIYIIIAISGFIVIYESLNCYIHKITKSFLGQFRIFNFAYIFKYFLCLFLHFLVFVILFAFNQNNSWILNSLSLFSIFFVTLSSLIFLKNSNKNNFVKIILFGSLNLMCFSLLIFGSRKLILGNSKYFDKFIILSCQGVSILISIFFQKFYIKKRFAFSRELSADDFLYKFLYEICSHSDEVVNKIRMNTVDHPFNFIEILSLKEKSLFSLNSIKNEKTFDVLFHFLKILLPSRLLNMYFYKILTYNLCFSILFIIFGYEKYLVYLYPLISFTHYILDMVFNYILPKIISYKIIQYIRNNELEEILNTFLSKNGDKFDGNGIVFTGYFKDELLTSEFSIRIPKYDTSLEVTEIIE